MWTNQNVWQDFAIKQKFTYLTLGTNPGSITYYGAIRSTDNSDNQLFLQRGYITADGYNCVSWDLTNYDGTNNHKGFTFELNADGSSSCLRPIGGSSNTGLGSSTTKWATLNGINPGALSLPQTASTNIDTTNWNLRGGYICLITHTVDCYVCVQIQRSVDFGIWAIGVGRQTFRAVKDGSGNYLAMVWFPCIVGVGVMLYSVPLIDTPAEDREPDLNIQVAKYFPCQGNV